MRAFVSVLDPSGQEHELVHGDLIGRVWTAALQLNDGRISEAHAMISLREGELRLLALRGRFAVDGKPLDTVALEPGMVVQLARGVDVQVVEVHLPEQIIGVEGEHLPRQALPGVASFVAGPRLVAGWRDDALAHTWHTGDGTMVAQGGATRSLEIGDTLTLDGATIEVVALPTASASPDATRRGGSLSLPLRLVARFDTVHLHREGHPPVLFSGKQARLISELVAVGTSISWQALAGELWPDEADTSVLRSRLDVVLSRTRRKLRARGVRADLVRPDGAGHIELVLYGQDEVEDKT